MISDIFSHSSLTYEPIAGHEEFKAVQVFHVQQREQRLKLRHMFNINHCLSDYQGSQITTVHTLLSLHSTLQRTAGCSWSREQSPHVTFHCTDKGPGFVVLHLECYSWHVPNGEYLWGLGLCNKLCHSVVSPFVCTSFGTGSSTIWAKNIAARQSLNFSSLLLAHLFLPANGTHHTYFTKYRGHLIIPASHESSSR